MRFANSNNALVFLGRLLKFRRRLVQNRQVRLPPDRNDSCEQASQFHPHKCEAECRNSWPQFPAVLPAPRHSILHSFYNVLPTCARQQALHAEEVGVEYGCEDNLVDKHLDNDA